MMIKDLKPGDKVKASRLVTVDSIFGTDRSEYPGFYDKNGLVYREVPPDDNHHIPMWEFELIERPVKNWPPQEGDVWSIRNGTGEKFTYYILRTSTSLRAYFHGSTYEWHVPEWLKNQNPELEYRRSDV